MIYAIVDGEKVEAHPKTKGKCQLCERPVFSKCGETNVWHWAHYKDESCDSWYEPETEWHKNWKLIFGKENCEIIISKNGVRHIADIRTQEDVVIELQNSPIQKPIIRRRENFYGERMMWVINGMPFINNFNIYSSHSDYVEKYWAHYNYLQTTYGIVDKGTGEILSRPKNEVSFSWYWARKSWNEVQRHVFIDFGDEKLFWVKDGMGTSSGRGRQISKESFIKKYGGNITLLSLLIANSK